MGGALNLVVGLTAGYAVGGTLVGWVLIRLLRHPVQGERDPHLA
jgi:hypothetical protein